MNTSQQAAAAISLIEQTVPCLWAVYQFGSAGTPFERADSDLDLAFLAGGTMETVDTWDLGERIATRVGRDVDLVDLRRASTVMAAGIITSGFRLQCFNDNESAAFEAHTLADYARLNEARHELLADIQQRGRIHA